MWGKMAQNNLIKFLVTSSQKEAIMRNAQRHGYTTLSKYMRDLALANSNIIDKIDAIHRRIMHDETG